MREELTNLGFEELRTSEAVDEAVARKGTVMLVVNSVCGCAAARRGRACHGAAARRQADHVTTVFAGADIEATDRARGYFTGYPPSSPGGAAARRPARLHDGAARRSKGSRPA
jgi:putative YphP/YqiW family bacilliredoxin